jgi:hypothetical protein
MSVLARRSLVFRLVFLAVVYTGASANTPGMSIASARCVGSSPTARIAREIGVATQMGNERYSGYQKSDIRSQISEVRYQKSDVRSQFCPLFSVLCFFLSAACASGSGTAASSLSLRQIHPVGQQERADRQWNRSEPVSPPQIPPRVGAITAHLKKYNGTVLKPPSTVPGWGRGIGRFRRL